MSGNGTNGTNGTNGKGANGNGTNGNGNGKAPDDGGQPVTAPRPTMAVRGAMAPGEQSRDFGRAVTRVFARLRQERMHVSGVVVLAVIAVSMSVVGPKILGHATDLILKGIQGGGIDFTALHLTLALAAGLYLASAGLTYFQSWLLAGIVQGAMSRTVSYTHLTLPTN